MFILWQSIQNNCQSSDIAAISSNMPQPWKLERTYHLSRVKRTSSSNHSLKHRRYFWENYENLSHISYIGATFQSTRLFIGKASTGQIVPDKRWDAVDLCRKIKKCRVFLWHQPWQNCLGVSRKRLLLWPMIILPITLWASQEKKMARPLLVLEYNCGKINELFQLWMWVLSKSHKKMTLCHSLTRSSLRAESRGDHSVLKYHPDLMYCFRLCAWTDKRMWLTIDPPSPFGDWR